MAEERVSGFGYYPKVCKKLERLLYYDISIYIHPSSLVI